MNLTVAFITARHEPKLEWFLDSLFNFGDLSIKVIVVDLYAVTRPAIPSHHLPRVLRVEAKPSLWQGPGRLPLSQWWAKSGSLNTAAALCETDWLAAVDDRCVLEPHWLEAVKGAMKEGYGIAGAYEKREGLQVDNGKITNPGKTLAVDHREQWFAQYPAPMPAPFPNGHTWFYGCTWALPLEWILQVNGFSEDICDGCSYEDCAFGQTLENARFPMRYDPRLKIIEDRSPNECGPIIRRMDKGVSPKDKSHSIVDHFRESKESKNSYSLRDLRRNALAGRPWPAPTANDRDWWDGQLIKEFG